MSETRADRRAFERNSSKPLERQLGDIDFLFTRAIEGFVREACREHSKDIVNQFMQEKFGGLPEEPEPELSFFGKILAFLRRILRIGT